MNRQQKRRSGQETRAHSSDAFPYAAAQQNDEAAQTMRNQNATKAVRLTGLKEAIERGEYKVDASKVAENIIDDILRD